MVQSLDDARRRSQGGSTGRVPPYNLQAEESLLGAMLLSRDAIAAAVETCAADDFYKPAHGHVFEAVCSLYAQGEPADPVTVADELRRAGLLDAIGGPAILITLQANTPATTNAGRYARIVEEHALLRRLIGVSGEIAEIAYGVPEDVAAAVDRAETLVFEVAERRVTDSLRPLHDLLAESLDRLESLYDRGESITGVPTGYIDLDERLSGLQPSSLIIVGARPSMGKAQPVDTPVLTPGGWRAIGSLAVGDRVIGGDGRPTPVAGVFPQGRLPVYRVVLSDGTSTRASADHLWLVQTSRSSGACSAKAVRTTAEIRASLSAGSAGRHYLPVVAPVQHPEADLPVDPYLLGLLIGRGDFSGATPTFTTSDPELLMALEARLPFGVVAKPDPDDPTRYSLVGWPPFGASVPGPYLFGSVAQRLALLQGLMDIDGWHSENGTRYTAFSPARAANLAELARSLGAVARVLPSCAVELTLPAGVVPFRLQQKIDRYRANGPLAHQVVSVTADGDAECVCIAVEAADNLYVTEDHIVTHNTALALGMAAHAAMHALTPVLFFSLEMSHSEVTQRLLCSEARVDSTRIRNGKLLESDWPKISHAIGRLGEAPLYIDDNPNVTVMEIRAKARRLRSRLGGLGLIIVDYLQLMSGRHSAENRQVEVSEISRGLKILARELEVPVVALSQLSRNLEMRADKRPVLADLRESGCLTADAEVLRCDTGATATMGELLRSGERDIPVWTLDDRLRMVPGVMSHVFPTGIKDVFELSLASGRRVTASANHPFLTVDGWTRLDELAVGDHLAVASAPGQDLAGDDRIPAEIWRRIPEMDMAGPRRDRISRQELRAIADDLGDANLQRLATSEIAWDQVVAITPRGQEPVFDATVAGTHNFIANGIVVENSLEQDADVVMFLYRDEVYNPDSPDRGSAELIISKHRNGPTGITNLAFLGHETRFANIARV